MSTHFPTQFHHKEMMCNAHCLSFCVRKKREKKEEEKLLLVVAASLLDLLVLSSENKKRREEEEEEEKQGVSFEEEEEEVQHDFMTRNEKRFESLDSLSLLRMLCFFLLCETHRPLGS